MARAYLSGQHTMAAIARHFGVHYSAVSRMVRAHEESMAGCQLPCEPRIVRHVLLGEVQGLTRFCF